MSFIDHTAEVIARLAMANDRALTRIGMMVQSEIRASMKSGGPGKPGRRPHSPVGSPPNVQTNRLRQSITYQLTGSGFNRSVQIGTDLVYGAVHELSRTHPRPFIKPVIIGKAKTAQQIHAEELRKA